MPSFSSLLRIPFLLVLASSFAQTYGQSVHLATGPNCGKLGGPVADVNAGLQPLSSYQNIIAFGDGWSDGGVHTGAALGPATLTPPNPRAGGRQSNGPIWLEYLFSSGKQLKDFAVDGGVVDKTSWSTNSIDFTQQMNTLSGLGSAPSANTLYVIFFGIKDYELYTQTGNSSPISSLADKISFNILRLASSPTFAKNVLVIDNYGKGLKSPPGESYKQKLFATLSSLRQSQNINFGFVDFANLWRGILAAPAEFGYTSVGACTTPAGNTTVGACGAPGTTLYWLPNFPSTATHKIMADYAQAVVNQCS